jgi:hypothetical protein
MSHDVQLNPAASHSPAATRPSPPSAGQSPRRQPAAADGRTEATGQARDIATPQKSGLRGHISPPCHGFPGRNRRGGNRPSRSRQAPGLPPAAPLPSGFSRRSTIPPLPAGGRGGGQAARANRRHRRTALPAGPAGHSQPARLLTATGLRCTPDIPGIDPGCTWHLPRTDLRRHRAQASAATTLAHPILHVMWRTYPRCQTVSVLAGPVIDEVEHDDHSDHGQRRAGDRRPSAAAADLDLAPGAISPAYERPVTAWRNR